MSEPGTLRLPELGLSAEEATNRCARLQQKLVPLWASISALNQDEQTIVVVPSITIEFDVKGAEMQAYEERFLFLLLLLRQPRARLIYVTSQAILPSTVDYYLGLLPGVIVSHARSRLFLVSRQDRSPRPLTVKLLERPHLIERIRSLITDPARAHLIPYNTTTLERDLALRLGIPMYGTAEVLALWDEERIPPLIRRGVRSTSRGSREHPFYRGGDRRYPRHPT